MLWGTEFGWWKGFMGWHMLCSPVGCSPHGESHGQQHSAGVRVKYLPVLLRMHKSQGLIEHHHPLPWHWDKPWHFGWIVPHLETKTIFERCLFESMKNPLLFEFTTLACGNLSKVSLKTRTALHRTMPPTEEVAGSHFGSLYS